MPNLPVERHRNPYGAFKRERGNKGRGRRYNTFGGKPQERLPGSGGGRLATQDFHVRLDTPLYEWLRDRAAILGVPYTILVRDVIATWCQLVVSSERERGIDLSAGETTIVVPDRVPGYGRELIPKGKMPSHLDPSPLSIEEME